MSLPLLLLDACNNSLLTGLPVFTLALFQSVFHRAARLILLKHVIPLLITLQCLPSSLRIKADVLSITYYMIWLPVTSMPNYSLASSPTSFPLSLCFSHTSSLNSSASLLPQDLCTCCSYALNALHPDTHMTHALTPSISSFKSLIEAFCRSPI